MTGLLYTFMAVGALAQVVKLFGLVPGGEPSAVDAFQLLVTLAIVVAYCIWINRSICQLAPLVRLPFGRHAWVWIFVPILQLWRPFQIVVGIWKGRTGEADAPPIFHIWWGALLTWLGTENSAEILAERTLTPEVMASVTLVQTLAELSAIGAAYLAIRVVAEVNHPSVRSPEAESQPALGS